MYKILQIPGFLDTVDSGYYGTFPGLDIWNNKINWSSKVEADYIVGDSAGAFYALTCWRNGSTAKVILVSPIFTHRSRLGLFIQLLKFMVTEGTPLSWRRVRLMIWNFFPALYKLNLLLAQDNWGILESIPKDHVLIIRGALDHYLFEESVAQELIEKGYDVTTVPGVGHVHNPRFTDIINNFIYAK